MFSINSFKQTNAQPAPETPFCAPAFRSFPIRPDRKYTTRYPDSYTPFISSPVFSSDSPDVNCFTRRTMFSFAASSSRMRSRFLLKSLSSYITTMRVQPQYWESCSSARISITIDTGAIRVSSFPEASSGSYSTNGPITFILRCPTNAATLSATEAPSKPIPSFTPPTDKQLIARFAPSVVPRVSAHINSKACSPWKITSFIASIVHGRVMSIG
mmetsp:Transcript_13852/g.30116  ORF Transcript_13852/g.30116 Transcript_13852/m.30116 type:complete len:214 (-) Transcript_13852:355-996(-)